MASIQENDTLRQSDPGEKFDTTTTHLESVDVSSRGENPGNPITQVQFPNENDGEDFKWSWDVYANLFALYITAFSTFWSYALVATSLAFIKDSFPMETATAPWVAAVPNLCLCVLSLFFGELSDIFGRRIFIITGNLLAVAGNLICSRGSSINMIIGGQTITGVGISATYLFSPLLAELVPKRSRGIIIGIAVGGTGIIVTSGSIAQGAFVKYHVGGVLNGWRCGVYIGAGLAALAFVLSTIFYHPGHRPNPEGLSTLKRLRNIDWVGIVIGTAGLTLMLIGLQFGGNPYPWDSALVLSLILVGGTTIFVFGIWEWKFAKFGLFPRALFVDRNFPVVVIVQFIEGIAINSATAFLNQMTLTLYTTDAVLAYVRYLPFCGATFIGAGIGGIILYKTKEAKWLLVGSLAVIIIGSGLMSILQPHMNFAAWFFPTALLGFGVACLGVGVSVVASLATPNHLIGTALSVCTSFRGLGGAIGIVAFSQILEAKLKVNLPKKVAEDTIAAGLPPSSVEQLLLAFFSGDTAALEKVPGISLAVGGALEAAVPQAYADSWRYIWYALIPFCVVTCGAALFIRSTKSQMTQEVASHVLERHGHHHHLEEKLQGLNV